MKRIRYVARGLRAVRYQRTNYKEQFSVSFLLFSSFLLSFPLGFEIKRRHKFRLHDNKQITNNETRKFWVKMIQN